MEMEVDIELIKPSPYQPRLIFEIDELKQEIESDGLISELVVRKQNKNYELIDGERRLKALKKLGWKKVPVRVIKLKKDVVRRSVYKVNKVRENYSVEEESKYFKKLTDEGMTPWEISKELGVDFHWVLAHLNIFRFPEKIQKALWTGQISASHMVALENVIGRSINEAQSLIIEIINRKLTLKETKKIVKKQKQKVEEMRIEAVEEILPEVAPKVAKLKTAEDFEKAAKILRKTAKKKRETTLTPEEKALIEKKKKQKKEALKKRKIELEKLEKIRIKKEAKKLAKEMKEKQRLKIEKEAKKVMEAQVKEEAQKLAQVLSEKERSKIRKELEKDMGVRIKEEAQKLAQQLEQKSRLRIKKEVKKEVEDKSLAKLKRSMKKLTKRIETLQKEKATLLDNKKVFLEALNFNCPHCKSSCVVYQEGNQYFVKRSAKVSIIPEKPVGPSPSLSNASSTKGPN
jgi:ParB family chromosome partitioning protein